MEEPKNLNNPPVNQPVIAAAPKSIPTIAGAMIILIVAVIVGAGIFYILQTDSSDNSYNNNLVISNKSLKSKTETTETAGTKENGTIAEIQAVEEAAAEPATGETFNFDYELKKLDDQNNSVSSDDFNENEMSDANIGL
jgi:uncharacterized protein HemX